MAQTETINFYSVSDPYGEFSNFAAFPIRLDGKTWPTTEHYFQAMKFLDEKHQSEIRTENSPMKAARMGRSRKRPLRKDWESVKDAVMEKAVLAKFTQHEELRACCSKRATRSLSSTRQMILTGAMEETGAAAIASARFS